MVYTYFAHVLLHSLQFNVFLVKKQPFRLLTIQTILFPAQNFNECEFDRKRINHGIALRTRRIEE